MLVLWALWEARNNAKFENIPMRSDSIVSRVVMMVGNLGKAGLLGNKHWNGNVNLAASFGCANSCTSPPSIQPQIVRWNVPLPGRLKVNTDGAARGSNGGSGGGCIIRDANGDCLWGMGWFFGNIPALEAEATTLYRGLIFCNRMGLYNLDIESDSLTLNHIVRSGGGNWKIAQFIDRISAIIEESHSTIKHIFREANSAADYLANYAVDIRGDFSMKPPCISTRLCAIALLDISCPYIR